MSNKEEKEKERFSEEYIENAKTQINKLFFDRIGGLVGFSDSAEDSTNDTNTLNLNYQEREECEDDEEVTTQTVNVYSTIGINDSQSIINKTFTIKDNEAIIIDNDKNILKKEVKDNDSDYDEKEYQKIKIEYIKISKRYFELKEKRMIKKRK
ncbi:hypothetical protein RB653_005560 [Dictyostelium firmibasis]|uniref:Uncharacterized protein n=1 Tax=Dictyostelium firmibasis TaxID=79012 RepID=A0AAN7YT26_9MYCE